AEAVIPAPASAYRLFRISSLDDRSIALPVRTDKHMLVSAPQSFRDSGAPGVGWEHPAPPPPQSLSGRHFSRGGSNRTYGLKEAPSDFSHPVDGSVRHTGR